MTCSRRGRKGGLNAGARSGAHPDQPPPAKVINVGKGAPARGAVELSKDKLSGVHPEQRWGATGDPAARPLRLPYHPGSERNHDE